MSSESSLSFLKSIEINNNNNKQASIQRGIIPALWTIRWGKKSDVFSNNAQQWIFSPFTKPKHSNIFVLFIHQKVIASSCLWVLLSSKDKSYFSGLHIIVSWRMQVTSNQQTVSLLYIRFSKLLDSTEGMSTCIPQYTDYRDGCL